jgi:cyanate permease
MDRFSTHRLVATGAVIMGVSMVLRGLSVDFYTLLFAVGLFAFGGPLISVAAPKVVAQWFSGSERNFATGAYISGPIAGIVIGLLLANSVVVPLTGSWRGVQIVYGLAALAAALIWYLLARDPKRQIGAGEKVHKDPEGSVLRALLRVGNVRLVLVLALASFLLQHGLVNWAPTLLDEAGMTPARASMWAAIGVAAGAVGVLTVPAFARLGRRRVVLAALLAGSALGTAGLAFTGGGGLIASLLVANIASTPLFPILTLILIDTEEVGMRRIGAAVGLAFAASEIGGFAGPLMLGVVRDATGSLAPGMLVLAVITASLLLLTPLIRERRTETAT